MKIRNAFLLVCATALLVACGSKDDDGPAELEKSDLGRISPFDTLVVEFDQKILLPNADDVVSASDLKYKVVKTDGRKLLLTGDSTMAGFGFFEPGSDYTLTFSNVTNEAGDRQKEPQTVRFSTMPVLDSDFTKCATVSAGYIVCNYNDGLDRAEQLSNASGTAFFNGALLTEGVQVAGMLAFNKMRNASQYGKDDLVDHYLLKLKMDDTVEVELSGLRQSLDFRFMGPRKLTDSTDFREAQAQSSTNEGILTEKITYVIGREHREGANDFNELADYAIRVYFKESNPAGASPYVLSVKVRPYR